MSIAARHLPMRMRWLCAAAFLLVLTGGCSALREAVTPSAHPAYYALTYAPPAGARNPGSRAAPNGPTLIVGHTHAAAGFDSSRIMYLRHADQLEYFAYNEWIDTPARMLAPLLVTAVEANGAFRAAVLTPSPASGELRLDTEILRLQHEFLVTPSQVRFTLRANLLDNVTRRVIATREFEAVAAAPSEDPRGGVTAANDAVKKVLTELAAFCAQTAGAWKPGPAGAAGR